MKGRRIAREMDKCGDWRSCRTSNVDSCRHFQFRCLEYPHRDWLSGCIIFEHQMPHRPRFATKKCGWTNAAEEVLQLRIFWTNYAALIVHNGKYNQFTPTLGTNQYLDTWYSGRHCFRRKTSFPNLVCRHLQPGHYISQHSSPSHPRLRAWILETIFFL